MNTAVSNPRDLPRHLPTLLSRDAKHLTVGRTSGWVVGGKCVVGDLTGDEWRVGGG